MGAKAVVKGPMQGKLGQAGTLAMADQRPSHSVTELRQQRVDAKAFKGRGTAVPQRSASGGSRSLHDALEAVARVHDEMANLATLTLGVHGRVMYLCLHRRKLTQQVSLRWRRCNCADAHVPWPEVEGLLRANAPDLAQWYAEVDRTARALNEREIAARYTLKHARRNAAKAQQDVICPAEAEA